MKTRRIILIAGVTIIYIMYFVHIIILCLLRKKMASDENNNTNIAVDVNNNINNDPIRVNNNAYSSEKNLNTNKEITSNNNIKFTQSQKNNLKDDKNNLKKAPSNINNHQKNINYISSNNKDNQSYTQFQSVIDKYKKANEAMRKEINLNQYENIINNENGYKRNLQILKKLEKENEYLTKVNKELQETKPKSKQFSKSIL